MIRSCVILKYPRRGMPEEMTVLSCFPEPQNTSFRNILSVYKIITMRQQSDSKCLMNLK